MLCVRHLQYVVVHKSSFELYITKNAIQFAITVKVLDLSPEGDKKNKRDT